MREDIDMKRQYIAPETEVMKMSAVVMQSASKTNLSVSATVAGEGVIADGKENEISSGSIWDEEE